MDSFRSYLLSVICAAMACALVRGVGERKGTAGTVLKLVTGIFLAFTVITPVADLEIEELSIFTEGLQEEAAYAAAMGQSIADESMAAIIKEKTEAYILDKATALNTDLTAEITLREDFQPEAVILTGEVSAYAKLRLEMILEEDLGIAKENQQWNESPSF